MQPIERLKQEVLIKLNAKAKELPNTIEDILHQLSTRDSWARLDYIVAKDIESFCDLDFIGDAFYTKEELELLNK